MSEDDTGREQHQTHDEVVKKIWRSTKSDIIWWKYYGGYRGKSKKWARRRSKKAIRNVIGPRLHSKDVYRLFQLAVPKNKRVNADKLQELFVSKANEGCMINLSLNSTFDRIFNNITKKEKHSIKRFKKCLRK